MCFSWVLCKAALKCLPGFSSHHRVKKNLLATDPLLNSLWFLMEFISLQEWNLGTQFMSGSHLEASLTYTGHLQFLPQDHFISPLTIWGLAYSSPARGEERSQLARLSLTIYVLSSWGRYWITFYFLSFRSKSRVLPTLSGRNYVNTTRWGSSGVMLESVFSSLTIAPMSHVPPACKIHLPHPKCPNEAMLLKHQLKK